MKFQFKAKVITGGLLFNKDLLTNGLKDVPINTTVLVTITDQRSIDQNALLHVYLTEIANETGEELNNIKSYLKHLFLGYEYHKINVGCDTCEEVKELRSTTSLTIKEFALFLTQIESWAMSNLGIRLSKEMYA